MCRRFAFRWAARVAVALFIAVSVALLVTGCDDVVGGGVDHLGSGDDEADGDGSPGGNDDAETTYLYDGFQELSYSVGDYWEYSWTYEQTSNGSQKPTESGTVRIELVDSVTVDFEVIGELTLFETNYSNKSGDPYPLSWAAWTYLAVKDGVMYIGQSEDSEYGVAALFDPRDGSIYTKGFIGYYFSESRDETVYEDSGLVVVSEPFYDPNCETIAGQYVCDGEYHDYDVREYYRGDVGFYGFYRSGASSFSGGGYYDTFTSTMTVLLSATSL